MALDNASLFPNMEEDFAIESPSITPIQSPEMEEDMSYLLNNSIQSIDNTHSSIPSYYDSNGTLQIVSQTMYSSTLEASIEKTPSSNDNIETAKTVAENDEEKVNEEEENVSESQEPVNFQDEFERRELEMQLGID